MSKNSCGKKGMYTNLTWRKPVFSHHAPGVSDVNICDNKYLFKTSKGRFQSPRIKNSKEQYLTIKQMIRIILKLTIGCLKRISRWKGHWAWGPLLLKPSILSSSSNAERQRWTSSMAYCGSDLLNQAWRKILLSLDL